jgi:hypothetical protein
LSVVPARFTQTYSPNLFSSRFWRAMVSFTDKSEVRFFLNHILISIVSVSESLIFSLVPSDNRNTRYTCPTSVFTSIGQMLMSRPVILVHRRNHRSPKARRERIRRICSLLAFGERWFLSLIRVK